TAFQTIGGKDEFLDALTELDVAGFYLIIRRNANSLQNSVESASFSRFLYFCHVLAAINEYKVIVGYSDWHSFLVKAMDVTHTACGWYQNLRQFSLARYQPSTGGRRPRKRYSSPALLSNPLITPELQDIYLAGLLPTILSGSPHDSIIKNDPATGEVNWSEEVSCLTHWFSLNDISQRISRQPNALSRIQEVEQIIHDAMNLYRQLESNGVSFDPQTGPRHIVDWQDAVQEFRGLLGM
nr:hypothetical protein [bacterium]